MAKDVVVAEPGERGLNLGMAAPQMSIWSDGLRQPYLTCLPYPTLPRLRHRLQDSSSIIIQHELHLVESVESGHDYYTPSQLHFFSSISKFSLFSLS